MKIPSWNFLQRWADESPIGVLVSAFLLVLFVFFVAMLPMVLGNGPSNLSPPSLFADYERSLADAAIKKPSYAMNLATLDLTKPEVSVIKFGFPALQTGKQKLMDAMWVALPAQLKAACSGMRDAKRALQQILGLPPTTGPQVVYEITARPVDLFRPCMGGGNTTIATCSLLAHPGVPTPELKPPAATATPAEKDASYTALRNAYNPLREDYDRLLFVANQMWNTYRTGFPAKHATTGDYPYDGYPFTGMGWTYNWSPQSTMHVGVTEFVIPKDKEITVERALQPEEFCTLR